MATHRSCVACGRPLASPAARCVYCGETLPRDAAFRALRAALWTLAPAGTFAFLVAHVPPAPHLPSTPERALLLALGAGLAVLPPAMRGVAAVAIRDRQCQAIGRAGRSLLVTLLGACLFNAAVALHAWTPSALALAAPAALALLAMPFISGLPWLSLAAGLLLGIGLAGAG